VNDDNDEVEDVATIVHQRDGLRRQVKRLEAENRRLRVIVAGYAQRLHQKAPDAGAARRQAEAPIQR
jgi:hypothetical protein